MLATHTARSRSWRSRRFLLPKKYSATAITDPGNNGLAL
jgi:hypothetical protein